MEATYRIAEQTSHAAHWARVTTWVELAAADSVSVGDQAFAWREFPPGPEEEGMNAAAIEGVRRALGELPAGRPAYRVIVTKIEDAPADTCLDDIMRAAMHATWAALAQA